MAEEKLEEKVWPKECQDNVERAVLECDSKASPGLLEKGNVVYVLKKNTERCSDCGHYCEKDGKRYCTVYPEIQKVKADEK